MCLSPTSNPRTAYLLKSAGKALADEVLFSDVPNEYTVNIHAYMNPESVSDLPPGFNICLYVSPVRPLAEWAEKLNQFDRVVFPSACSFQRAEQILDEGKALLSGFPFNVFCDKKKPDWWDKGSDKLFRIHTIVPPHEVGVIYPLMRAYLDDWRQTDKVQLIIRTTVKDVSDKVSGAIDHALKEIDYPRTYRPRYRVVTGDWDFENEFSFSQLGDLFLLPWAGCSYPVELLFAMQSGKFVAAPDWCSSQIITPRSGTSLNYDVLSDCARIDWEQVSTVIRLAVAQGSRNMVPARVVAEQLFQENQKNFKDLVADLRVNYAL